MRIDRNGVVKWETLDDEDKKFYDDIYSDWT
jgi:hypothetical protein